jgi:hypothetical protein
MERPMPEPREVEMRVRFRTSDPRIGSFAAAVEMELALRFQKNVVFTEWTTTNDEDYQSLVDHVENIGHLWKAEARRDHFVDPELTPPPLLDHDYTEVMVEPHWRFLARFPVLWKIAYARATWRREAT